MGRATVGTIEKSLVVKENTVAGILNYGIDNLYAQRAMRTIAASGTATSCCELFAKFIHGQGFKDDKIGKLIVNRLGQTTNKVLRKLAKDYSRIKGFALHFNYNALLEISEINFVPYEYCRLSVPDDSGYVSKIKVYDNWDRSRSRQINNKKIKEYHVFNPDPAIVLSQIIQAGSIEQYRGQILWFSDDDKEYPASTCDAVLEDVVTDSKIKVFNFRTVTTGFMSGCVFVHKGKFKNDTERNAFIANINSFQGADESNKILVVEIENDEEIPDIKEFPIISNDKLFELMGPTVQKNIVRKFNQPLILLQIETPGSLGGSKEVKDAQDIYDDFTKHERLMFSEVFGKIFSFWKDPLPEDMTIIPVSGIKVEIKKQTLASTIGIGGLQSFQTIVESTIMLPQQKINYLILVFGVEKADAEALINTTEITLPE